MSLDDLCTLATRPTPDLSKSPKGTRLDQAEAERKADERALETWKKGVRFRDGNKCRHCGRRVVVTLKLQANRAEIHHVTGRAHKPTRYDVRNGIQLCAACHQKVERNELQIVSTQTFTIGNREYSDMTDPQATSFKELQ